MGGGLIVLKSCVFYKNLKYNPTLNEMLNIWLRIESSAIINLRGVSTKLNKYIIFTMQMYKELIWLRI